jgi:uncharacterized protein (UPF0261 family)
MRKTIAILATLDSKGREAAFVASQVKELGHAVVLIDVGILGKPAAQATVAREQVARAADTNLASLCAAGDRGAAIAAMARGAAVTVTELHHSGRIDGLLGLGGSSGSAIAGAAMQALPIGFPKVLVSTMGSGNTRPYVGARDVTLMHSVVDISGLNRISRQILANAAAAVCGMAAVSLPHADDRPMIALTMMGLTTPCATVASAALEDAGFEVLAFHANGPGGQAMEALIEEGLFAGVLDMTPAEWADELFGGKGGAGPERMEAAGRRSLPQVVSVGGLDMVRFGPLSAVPGHYRSRHLHQHNPTITLMRTTPQECRQLGELIAAKLNRARGPTHILLPLRGFSNVDRAGGVFEDEEARCMLFTALREKLQPQVKCVEVDLHINDPEFGRALASDLISLIK